MLDISFDTCCIIFQYQFRDNDWLSYEFIVKSVSVELFLTIYHQRRRKPSSFKFLYAGIKSNFGTRG